MLDIMCPLISESDTVSHELLDIILINVVEPNKTQKRNAYALAKELINKCSDTLEPYIQAVNSIMIIRSTMMVFEFHLRDISDFLKIMTYHSLLILNIKNHQSGRKVLCNTSS